jgi:putative acetyltransferase
MPAPLITIREERADQPEVVALLDALDRYLGSLYEPEANHILGVEALLAPEVTFLVARDGAQIVGTGACRRMQAEAATGGLAYGEIKRMYVDPARRGERIGARVLEALEARLRSEGYRQALLETGREQVEAVKLYERAGYVERGPFAGYPDNGLSVFYGKAL